MTLFEIQSVLDRFDGFDGGIVQSVVFSSEQGIGERKIVVRLRAFSVSQNQGTGWKLVSITASDHPIFSWVETTRTTNLVLNYPALIVEDQEKMIIDFDPLHGIANESGIKLSQFFIGGRSLSISVVEIENR